MKVRIILCFVVVVLLLLGTNVLAQHGGQFVVETGTASGGNYQLTSLSWQMSDAASGGGYRLLGPAVPILRGSGCCCTYLPMTLRNWQ